jgi:hypothetical protein
LKAGGKNLNKFISNDTELQVLRLLAISINGFGDNVLENRFIWQGAFFAKNYKITCNKITHYKQIKIKNENNRRGYSFYNTEKK